MSSSSDIRRVGETGVHTIEGNLAGSRAAQLTKQREKQQAEYEAKKSQIKQLHSTDLSRINDKFSAASNAMEQDFQRKTVGLVSAEEFRKAREAQQEEERQAQVSNMKFQEEKRSNEAKFRQDDRDKKRKLMLSTLSFGEDEDVEAEEVPMKKVMKDPTVDTSFLPDIERDQEISRKKEELKKEWLLQQDRIKAEIVQVTYSYWDGSGHRKVIAIKKGLTIGKFLEQVKAQLVPEFTELRSTNTEDLMYVKEDLIIPQHFSFYDLIVTKARGKSGPLFHFDVHDDIRLLNDATVEKDESHPGKVVERRWYERNKHIFPASRWEIYDPSDSREGQQYTIHGGETQK